MNDIEEQVRRFVRDGQVPVIPQPAMLDRVERGMRLRRRQTTVAAAAVAAVATIGGVALAAVVAQSADGRDNSQVAADPTGAASPGGGVDCSGVTILAAETTTAESTNGRRGLALVLEHEAGADKGCLVGVGTRIDLTAGRQSATASVSSTLPVIPLGAGDTASIRLDWSNWCETTLPEVAVTFSDGSTARLPLPIKTAVPQCIKPGEASVLVVEDVQLTDVQSGGRPPRP